MNRTLLQAFYIAMALLFFIICIVFTFANLHIDRVINDVFVSIANGTSINEFNRLIVALVSSAKFRIIDTNLAALVAIPSLFTSYIFLQAYLFTKRGIPFRRILKLKYWTVFIPSMSYRYYSRKKNDEKK